MSNTPASLVSVVDEVLRKAVHSNQYIDGDSEQYMPENALDESIQALLAAFEEVANRVIGDDEPNWIVLPDYDEVEAQDAPARNELRVEQREMLQKEMGR